jgi:hypothetical protein
MNPDIQYLGFEVKKFTSYIFTFGSRALCNKLKVQAYIGHMERRVEPILAS